MQYFIWNRLSNEQQNRILQRPAIQNHADITQKTQQIIQHVRVAGDKALYEFTAKFDKAHLTDLKVNNTEILHAPQKVTAQQLQILQTAVKRLTEYHQAHIPQAITVDSHDGIVCQRIPRAIDSVGLYVPGGSAPLVSTLMMLAIPAKLAGCPIRYICTPPDATGTVNPLLLTTAALCDIDTIYKIGGAQAIAAMAYGTETLPKVAKIFGPGNSWVTAAKTLVAQDPQGASIDMPAGPSEVLVIADGSANPAIVASDLLSQAEHGADSQVILLTDDTTLATDVQHAVVKQCETLARKTIIEQALQHSIIIVVDDLHHACDLSNRYAPEHLILQVADPQHYLPAIQNAGAVFIGPWAAETMGDYITGSNHVLPTYGYAKSHSSLSVMDFMHFLSIQHVSQHALQQLGPIAMALADMEGLAAHHQAVALRLAQIEER